jgi:hypothetical protein
MNALDKIKRQEDEKKFEANMAYMYCACNSAIHHRDLTPDEIDLEFEIYWAKRQFQLKQQSKYGLPPTKASIVISK